MLLVLRVHPHSLLSTVSYKILNFYNCSKDIKKKLNKLLLNRADGTHKMITFLRMPLTFLSKFTAQSQKHSTAPFC